MSTSAHNAYVALAKQAARQAKRQHLSIKRAEALAILADKEACEARIRDLEKRVKESEAALGVAEHARDTYKAALRGEGAKI